MFLHNKQNIYILSMLTIIAVCFILITYFLFGFYQSQAIVIDKINEGSHCSGTVNVNHGLTDATVDSYDVDVDCK